MREAKLPLPKRLVWMGDSLERLRTFPKEVREVAGFALYQAQMGSKHIQAKPLRGFGSGVLEVVADFRGDTFRAVYTVRFAGRVHVLHAFQKKSVRGISTPARTMDLVRTRLRQATELHGVLED